MGFKFTEKELIHDNIFKYEEKLNTQVSRFLDRTPMYITYYNINTIETTVDLGFSNTEKILGSNSPIKYSEIKNFPVYGMEQILLQLEDDEEGLNTTYDGELIILPDTIKPYPEDFFLIEHRGYDFLFKVTGVEYDTIKSNNYYKLQFTIKYVEDTETQKILKQVNTKYTCVVDNIGTEDKCIIEDGELEALNKLQSIYNEMSERYVMYFFNKKYNNFIYVDSNNNCLYDRYISAFIQKHGLFYDKDSHKCLYVTNEDETCCFPLEYDRSIFKAYELRKPKRIPEATFSLNPIGNMYSVFKYYRVQNCYSVRFAKGLTNFDYINKDLIRAMKNAKVDKETHEVDSMPIYYLTDNLILDNDDNKFTALEKTIINYLNDNINTVYDIDLEELEDDVFFDLTWGSFIKIPLFLYAVKGYYKLFVKKQVVKY